MNKRIIVFGSSGHARSITVILEALGYEIVGFIDSYVEPQKKVLNYRILGAESILKNCKEKYGTNQVVIGVGDILGRMKVVKLIESINPNIEFPSIIAPTATVANYTQIGKGTIVFNNAFINVESVIGDFCIINSSSIVEHNTVIEDFCCISPGANLGGDVIVKANTFIGSSATIIQKRHIGTGSVIGAGAIVTKNIPDNVLAVGMPAKIKKENYSTQFVFKE